MKNYAAAVLLRSRSRTVFTPIVLAVVLAASLVGCGGDDDPASETTTSTAPATTVTTTTPVTTSIAPSTTVASSPTTVNSASTTVATGGGATVTDPVPDGTSFGYLTAVNVGGSTISIDIAELLTGDAAVKAAIEDGALEPGETSIDNDYYIRNKNPKIRTAPLGPTVAINVLDNPGSPDLRSGTLSELAEALAQSAGNGSGEAATVPIQIVASAGVVSRIDQVFFP